MNAPHEEAVEFAKVSKRENRVYVGNLSYDVKYRDLMEFMRGGGWGNILLVLDILRLLGEARGAKRSRGPLDPKTRSFICHAPCNTGAVLAAL
jgi:hypothetical protein